MGMEIQRKNGKGTEHFRLLPWHQVSSNSPRQLWRNQIIFIILWICKGKTRHILCCWLRIAQGVDLTFQHILQEPNGNPARLKGAAEGDYMGFGGTWQQAELGMGNSWFDGHGPLCLQTSESRFCWSGLHHPINAAGWHLWPGDLDYIYSAFSMFRLVFLVVVKLQALILGAVFPPPLWSPSSLSEKGIWSSSKWCPNLTRSCVGDQGVLRSKEGCQISHLPALMSNRQHFVPGIATSFWP